MAQHASLSALSEGLIEVVAQYDKKVRICPHRYGRTRVSMSRYGPNAAAGMLSRTSSKTHELSKLAMMLVLRTSVTIASQEQINSRSNSRSMA